MMGLILVINSGSSSIKYQLIEPESGEVHAKGSVEKIGEDSGHATHTGAQTAECDDPVSDHEAGLRLMTGMFAEHGPHLDDVDLVGIGHRVVHGGEGITAATVIDDDVLAMINRLSPLAPLHNPANVTGIRVARQLFPDLPHVAVCDTAYFHDLPTAARTYAIDCGVAEDHHIRRYGFHGISHEYVAGRAAVLLDRDDLRQIVLHLGNGCSSAAVVSGRPVETSMGLTPLEGLVMGSRSGDIDPAVVFHLTRAAGMSVDDVETLLNQRSGLEGMTGHNDMREVISLADDGDENARLALEVYVHRLRTYLGAHAATMGGVDAISFTAGVGEHSPLIRERTLQGLEFLGVELDHDANAAEAAGERTITSSGSRCTVLVIPTNEELSIARQAAQTLT